MIDKVFVNEPLLNGNEKKYLSECIDTGWVSSEGRFVKSFEEKFSKKVERSFGIAVCNGTAALEIAVKALGLHEGDEVIMPTFTIISCAAAIIRSGATPVLVDSEPNTWNIDISQIEAKVSEKTKAILVVHIYGLPVDMKPIIELSKKYKLKIIEDAAEMHGQFCYDKPCGSFGDISIFSFYPNKLITCGEGGMIVTDDDCIAERCRSYRNLCFQKENRFVHEELGWNYRMSNLQAAVGVAQLERYQELIDKKRWIGEKYTELLEDISSIQIPLESVSYSNNIYWVYGIVLKSFLNSSTDVVREKLRNKGVHTRPFFWPMHEQPVFKKMGLFNKESYPVAEYLARRGFYIPSGLSLNLEQIKYVSETLHQVIQ